MSCKFYELKIAVFLEMICASYIMHTVFLIEYVMFGHDTILRFITCREIAGRTAPIRMQPFAVNAVKDRHVREILMKICLILRRTEGIGNGK